MESLQIVSSAAAVRPPRIAPAAAIRGATRGRTRP